MVRIIVTGGAGFIGSGVARRLVDTGAEVLVIDDLSGGTADAVPLGARLRVVDVADPAVIDAIGEFEPDAVVHAAAQVSVPRSVADPERDAAVNVRGTANVLRGLEGRPDARLVFLSSGGAVYGEADGATEDTPPAPLSPYGRHKLEAEGLVAKDGRPFGIVRLANVYGPGQRAGLEGGVVATFVERACARLPLEIHGGGRQVRDFVHVDDVARAILAVLAARTDGTWNVGTGTATSIRQLVRLLEEATGERLDVLERPRRAGDVERSRLAVERIRAELGWRAAIPIRDGLHGLLAVA